MLPSRMESAVSHSQKPVLKEKEFAELGGDFRAKYEKAIKMGKEEKLVIKPKDPAEIVDSLAKIMDLFNSKLDNLV